MSKEFDYKQRPTTSIYRNHYDTIFEECKCNPRPLLGLWKDKKLICPICKKEFAK